MAERTLYIANYILVCEVYGKSGRPVKWANPEKIFANNDEQAVFIARQRTHVGARLTKVHIPATNRRVY